MVALALVGVVSGGALILSSLVAPREARGDQPGWRVGGAAPQLSRDDDALARQLQTGGRRCPGTYANSTMSIAPSVARFESQPGQAFVYCLRSTATYEIAYYGRDSKLKQRFLKRTAHGTGFAYRWTGQETLLLTNHHVTTWPEVTDEENMVEGVPAGARRVSETLKIVRSDEDDFEPGFIPLSRVVTDPSLDASVVKTRTHLNIIPYAVGSSAALRTGNIVEVRGYPLGAFAASNVGKVTNPFVEDLDGAWNHTDVALDALVNRGNSGSPVLAVSCVTGEYELVGLFHAGYREGEAMNLAVGIDEVRPLMDKLQARPRQTKPEVAVMTPEGRAALASMLSSEGAIQQMRFGRHLAQVQLNDGDTFTFRIYSDTYPADPFVFIQFDEPLDQSDEPPQVTVRKALEPAYVVPAETLNGESREQLQRVVTALLTRLARMQQYREVAGEPPRSLTQHKRAERLLLEMSRAEKEQQDLLDGLEAMLERARQPGPVTPISDDRPRGIDAPSREGPKPVPPHVEEVGPPVSAVPKSP